MQFYLNNKRISAAEFSESFTEEAKILENIENPQIEVLIDTDNLRFSYKYGGFNPIRINIEDVLAKHQKYFYKTSFYKDPLARALGLKKGKEKPHVLDSTAGMLGDSLLMYSYGLASLTICERNPLVAALIKNALKVSGVNIKFHPRSFLSLKNKVKFDVIYFDPMYEEANKKTAPKKEMKIFRDIVGKDEDAKDVALKLKEFAKERLVIKRPSKASSLLEGPSHTISGKSTSYDVYL